MGCWRSRVRAFGHVSATARKAGVVFWNKEPDPKRRRVGSASDHVRHCGGLCCQAFECSTASFFMSLPYHIRERVYAYLIPRNTTIEVYEDHGRLLSASAKDSNYSKEPEIIEPYKDFYPLLSVSRRISGEVSHLLQSRNKISICPQHGLLELIGKHNWGCWRYVEVFYVKEAEVILRWLKLENGLSRLPEDGLLESLTIRFTIITDIRKEGMWMRSVTVDTWTRKL